MNKIRDKLIVKKVYNPIKLISAWILIILSFSVIIYAFPTGITGRTKKGSTPGCTCHGINPSTGVVVTINGPDTLAPGQTANYSLTITGGPLVRGGTDIAVSGGTLAPVSSELQLLNSELTHKAPKAPDSSVVTFEFTYTAPTNSGKQTIFANGNSVNFDGKFTGDEWNFAPNKTILVTVPTGVEDKQTILTYKLEQNYPNPFNPSTTISYTISQEDYITLNVYDINGREVAKLVNAEQPAGSHEVEFNAVNFPSGVYFYKINAGSFVQTKKMILLR